MQSEQRPRYYVVFAETAFNSWAEVRQNAPEELAQHIAWSKQLHEEGVLLMSGAFLDHPDDPVTTMGCWYHARRPKHTCAAIRLC